MFKNANLRKVILFFVLIILLKNAPEDIPGMKPSFALPQENFTIAIFREEGFPSEGVPKSLTPEWLYEHLSKQFYVEFVDISKLSDRARFNAERYNLLIMPYGEAFARDTFPFIKDYISAGGGLLNLAGRPFWAAKEEINGKWRSADVDDPYGQFLSQLGIKYYESLENDYAGLSVTTSTAYTPILPTHGNVFPYRIPARDFYFSRSGNFYFFPDDTKGKIDKTQIIYVKSWMNPYIEEPNNIPQKWGLIGAKGESHPLNPQNSRAEEQLTQIMEYLSFPVIIYGLESKLAAYCQGEQVRAFLKIINYGKAEEACSVQFKFLDEKDSVIYKEKRPLVLKPGAKESLRVTWQPPEFKSNFYKVTATLFKDDKVLDMAACGFVVKNNEILKNGPSLKVKDNIFLVDDEPSYLFGVNYYESKLGELVWLRPNMLSIRRDFKSMRSLGINFVRMHYHHSKWFRDYFSEVIGQEPDDYFQIADSTALPSERSLRILDAIIQIAQEEGLIFCMDIFSLVPKDMGEPVGWLGLRKRILDRKKIGVQKDFIKLLSLRYNEVEGITWDLWNEPRLNDDDLESLRNWAAEMKAVFRKNHADHPITIGDNLSLRLLDVLDYASIHTYYPEEFVSVKGLSKPFVFQEVWNDAGYSRQEEARQVRKMEDDFKHFLKTEAAGFMPWQWTRQARLWNNQSRDERWDDELGACAHDDGSIKPAGKTYSSLISGLK